MVKARRETLSPGTRIRTWHNPEADLRKARVWWKSQFEASARNGAAKKEPSGSVGRWRRHLQVTYLGLDSLELIGLVESRVLVSQYRSFTRVPGPKNVVFVVRLCRYSSRGQDCAQRLVLETPPRFSPPEPYDGFPRTVSR